MNWNFKTICAGAFLTGMLGLGGCVYRVHEPPPEPVPVGYTVTYDPVYYDRGWYDGGYWYWYGPNHRLYHELREERERRRYHERYERREDRGYRGYDGHYR